MYSGSKVSAQQSALTFPISVKHAGEDRFEITMHGHEVTVDQPRTDLAEGSGPTPTELFVASLASCTAFYGRRFLHARGLPDSVDVQATWTMTRRPARVANIAMTVEAPGVPAERLAAFRRALEHCTVHNSLHEPPAVTFEIVTRDSSDKTPLRRTG